MRLSLCLSFVFTFSLARQPSSFHFFPTANFDSLGMGCIGSAVGFTSFDFVHSSNGLLSDFSCTKFFVTPIRFPFWVFRGLPTFSP
jgi:hypothetical protein